MAINMKQKRLNPAVVVHVARKNSEPVLAAALRVKQTMRELAELRRPIPWLAERGYYDRARA